jgi:hypothetical protein
VCGFRKKINELVIAIETMTLHLVRLHVFQQAKYLLKQAAQLCVQQPNSLG